MSRNLGVATSRGPLQVAALGIQIAVAVATLYRACLASEKQLLQVAEAKLDASGLAHLKGLPGKITTNEHIIISF